MQTPRIQLEKKLTILASNPGVFATDLLSLPIALGQNLVGELLDSKIVKKTPKPRTRDHVSFLILHRYL